jgi:hypothetical protein
MVVNKLEVQSNPSKELGKGGSSVSRLFAQVKYSSFCGSDGILDKLVPEHHKSRNESGNAGKTFIESLVHSRVLNPEGRVGNSLIDV